MNGDPFDSQTLPGDPFEAAEPLLKIGLKTGPCWVCGKTAFEYMELGNHGLRTRFGCRGCWSFISEMARIESRLQTNVLTSNLYKHVGFE